MSQSKHPDFLRRWDTEPTPQEREAISLPEGFGQRMQQRVWEQWGVSLHLDPTRAALPDNVIAMPSRFAPDTDDETQADPHTSAVIVSLAAWKAQRPHHPKVLAATLRSGDLASSEISLRAAVGHGSPEQTDLTPKSYSAGELLYLDLRGPTDTPHYMTVLLRRGSEPIQLAYPYGPGDAYRPMHRLELEWEVETGPGPRTFLFLLSQQPLLDLSSLSPSPDQETWTASSTATAIANIPWEHVLHVDELHWIFQPKS